MQTYYFGKRCPKCPDIRGLSAAHLQEIVELNLAFAWRLGYYSLTADSTCV